MITFVGGSKFAKGGPNSLANMDSWGSISASRFGPGGPYPLADLDRGVQIQGSKSARTPAPHQGAVESVIVITGISTLFPSFSLSPDSPLLKVIMIVAESLIFFLCNDNSASDYS